jgi:hypothetical protein
MTYSYLCFKVDIYSIGVILVELFRSFGTGGEKCEVLGGLREGIHPTEWGGDTVLLKRLTALSPSERPSATDILVSSSINLSIGISSLSKCLFLVIFGV